MRYHVTLQHRETGDFQGWSVIASDVGHAIARAQSNAGGSAWNAVAVKATA